MTRWAPSRRDSQRGHELGDMGESVMTRHAMDAWASVTRKASASISQGAPNDVHFT
jgi:hypothetical protein